MTAENYKKYLEEQKALGETVSRPLTDTDRQGIWDSVFKASKKDNKEESKKSKKSK